MASYNIPDERQLHSIFQMVDRDRSNVINSNELQSALSNGIQYSQFNLILITNYY